MAHFNEFPQAQILHRLFECRSRVLSGGLPSQDAAAFLSGLLIASDVAGALALFAADIQARTVYVIGAPTLTALYAGALAANSFGARQLDGADAARAGLAQVYRRLSAREAIRV
jgi:2-dehydro-3-deoxygalactonokinase